MYSAYKSIHSPTVVEQCVKANFTSENETNLILGRCNFLEVYKVVQHHQTQDQNHDVGKSASLKMVQRFELFGNIESMCPVRLADKKKDSLILSFLDAKASIVDFDEETNGLKIVTLHYMEDDFLKEGCVHFVNRPIIVSEPRGRCAAFLIYDSKMVIIPFVQKRSLLEEVDVETENESKENEIPVKRQIIIHLKDLGIQNVKDYCFLHGYYEPTLLFLHENEKTWSGRLAVKKNTCSVTAVSLDVSRGHYPIIWSARNLSHDCYKLIPMYEPLGGALVVSPNSIVHIQEKATYALSFNDFAQQKDFGLNIQLDILNECIIFDTVAYAFLAKERILFSLRDGDLYLLTIVSESRSVKKIYCKRISKSVQGSCMCTLSDNLLFLGSRLGNSLLIQYTEKIEGQENKKEEIKEDEEPKKKKRKLNNEDKTNDSTNDFLALLEEEERSIWETTEQTIEETKQVTYALKVLDSIVNIAPLVNMIVREARILDTQGKREEKDRRSERREYQKLDIVTTSGYGKNGFITILHKQIQPIIIGRNDKKAMPFTVENVWALKKPKKDKDNDTYVVLSLRNSTKVLETMGTGLNELTNSAFITSEETLNTGVVGKNYRIVQVCRKRVRLLDGDVKLHEITLDKDVHASFILSPYVLLHFIDGSIGIVSTLSDVLDLSYPSLSKDYGKITAASLYKDSGVDDIFKIDKNIGSSKFCIVYWTSGVLEIYSLPSFQSVFTFHKFNTLPTLMFDEKYNKEQLRDFKKNSEFRYPYVRELLLRRIGSDYDDPSILALMSDNTLIIYQSFLYKESNNDERLSNLRFKRVQYYSRKSSRREPKLSLSSSKMFPSDITPHDTLFIPFDNIGGLRGVFKKGRYARMIFTERNQIRIHPMEIEGKIIAFTPFTSVMLQTKRQGFIYYNERGLFTFAKLSDDPLTFYNTEWPMKQVHMKRTVHFVEYDHKKDVYAVATSVKVLMEFPPESEISMPEGRYPPVTEDKYELKLLSNQFHTMDTVELKTHEYVLCMKMVGIIRDRLKPDKELIREDYIQMLVVGTGITTGEDAQCKGRMLLYQFEQSSNVYKFKQVTWKDVKGPASQICDVDGYLLVASGPKVFLYYYDWEEGQLVPCAFFDAQFYITSMVSMKRFILFGDRYKSAYFLRWTKHKGNALTLLSKDFNPLQVSACGMIVPSHGQLGLVVADYNKNVQIFEFAPDDVESLNGKKLLARADFHVGSEITKILRLRMKYEREKQFNLFCTLDGSIGYFAPIGESAYRLLSTLQSKMYTQLSHNAGLHPKAFRLYRPYTQSQHIYKKNIIDGQLIWLFTNLDTITQKEIARQVGSNPDVLLEDIHDIEEKTDYF